MVWVLKKIYWSQVYNTENVFFLINSQVFIVNIVRMGKAFFMSLSFEESLCHIEKFFFQDMCLLNNVTCSKVACQNISMFTCQQEHDNVDIY